MENPRRLKVKNKLLSDTILVYNSVGSTNRLIDDFLAKNKKPPIIVALEQQEGEGRLGRKWISSSGKGLWFSFHLEWKQADDYYILVFAIALAIKNALIKLGIDENLILLKWPNDVLVNRKKIAGILLKSEMRGQEIVGFIVGIGININYDKNDFGESLKDFAISLKMIDNENRDIIKSLISVIEVIDNFLENTLKYYSNDILEMWKRSSLNIGDPIRIQQLNKEPYVGEYYGIDTKGALLVKTKGLIKKILTGDVGV